MVLNKLQLSDGSGTDGYGRINEVIHKVKVLLSSFMIVNIVKYKIRVLIRC